MKNKQTDKKLLLIFLSVLKDPNNTLGGVDSSAVRASDGKARRYTDTG